MKTKSVFPWRLKPGDKICVFSHPDQITPHVVTIRRMAKYRSSFTGCMVWHFTYTDPYDHERTDWALCHGANRRRALCALPAEKMLIPATDETAAG